MANLKISRPRSQPVKGSKYRSSFNPVSSRPESKISTPCICYVWHVLHMLCILLISPAIPSVQDSIGFGLSGRSLFCAWKSIGCHRAPGPGPRVACATSAPPPRRRNHGAATAASRGQWPGLLPEHERNFKPETAQLVARAWGWEPGPGAAGPGAQAPKPGARGLGPRLGAGAPIEPLHIYK